MTSHYLGTKQVYAKPMTRAEYSVLRGWELPADENGADEGYLVEYMDGGQANHTDYIGYISWSPKDVFERSYRPTDALAFGGAIAALKFGFKVARKGWNGKGMYLFLVKATSFGPLPLPVEHGTLGLAFVDSIAMKTATDTVVVGWLASQTDMLAEDWEIVP